MSHGGCCVETGCGAGGEGNYGLLRSAAGGRGATVLALAFAALTFFLGLERRPRAYKFSISDDASAGREDSTGWMSFGIDLVNERALAGAGRFTQSVSAPVIVGRHAWRSEQQASREAGAQSSTRGAAAGASECNKRRPTAPSRAHAVAGGLNGSTAGLGQFCSLAAAGQCASSSSMRAAEAAPTTDDPCLCGVRADANSHRSLRNGPSRPWTPFQLNARP